MIRQVAVAGRWRVGAGNPLLAIAGPCVLESEPLAMAVAEFLSGLAARLGIPLA
ncbi:MAG: 3-deoxy-8-phosphooctulonate synthase, partial [Deltaproteobacteria bacterium]|nr:3-deoxy-8-phosphooctulonate synthase [Deltaproteobacteria bacterium]